MKKIILTILVILIVLTACKPTQPITSTTTPTGAVVIQEQQLKVQEQKEKTEEIPLTPVETAPKKETPAVQLPPTPLESKVTVEKSRTISPELRDLLQKADSELKSISYLYAESPDNVGFDNYFVKGTKMKIQLLEKNDYVIDDYFNVVYVDTVAKTAKGRCENKKRCISKTIDNTKRVYDLNYEEYRKKTPYEWIKMVDNAEIIGTETLNNHAITRIRTEKDGAKIEMLVDNRFGVPHRVKVSDENEERTYYFKNIMFNSVKDDDVVMK